ncbi:hypothetical protein NM208_g10912 [Fusarium decemcellulare]|uniref:Uncharacterized protein n=1 Tax=Fusarium decemcellulare TaxID=57161 RepID=A0ACC1RW59_9HYPO|nr:hypothetical protein NM208_g10912 [Fusarium decemcellulare]
MESVAKRCIESTTVSPHWLPSGNVFWYKRNFAPGKFHFYVVDAAEKHRAPAFDHKQLAEALREKKGERVDGDALPLTWIEPDLEASCVRFCFDGRKWQYGPGNDLKEWDGEFTDEPHRLLQKEVPSSHSSSEVRVDFVNRTGRTLKVFWIDWDSEPIYYMTIDNGATERQDTYVGHVWRLVDALNENAKAIYSAPDQGNDVVIIEHLEESSPEDCSTDHDGGPEAKEGSVSSEDSPLYLKDFNLWFRGDESQGIQLSNNGSEENPFDQDELHMSPDKRHAVAWQYHPKQDHKIHLVESSPDDQLQPKLHSIQYLKPGDRVRIDRPRLFNLGSHIEVPTDDALFKNQYSLQHLGWSHSSKEYRFLLNERGHQHIRVIGIGIDGSVRTLVEEKSNTFVDHTKLYFKCLDNLDEMIWSSERDGYNHLYLMDLNSGTVSKQITRGEWSVSVVEFVDQYRRRIWFQGYGLGPGEDPYHMHLACVNFDGSDFKILTGGDGSHSWIWSPDRHYFTDTWSRVDSPPTTVLRDAVAGEVLMELEKGDIKELEADGWTSPERFTAPGRDGVTLIYGIIICPANFDSTKKYPVLDNIYAGPQGFHVPKSFSALRRQWRWANQGYIVVQVDGMGTNWRGKAFHDVCYKNLHDSGLPDHIAWLKAAAATRPWMDISRVGIMGGSAGGQNAVAALLHHGDFFKAAIADSGCHDNRMDKLWWNELWMGYPVDEAYEQSSNMTHASKLKGALMLIVGELDKNVDPSSTFQLAHALNKANKNYEFVLIPGGGHGCGGTRYGLARQREFFNRHLQRGVEACVDLADSVDEE